MNEETVTIIKRMNKKFDDLLAEVKKNRKMIVKLQMKLDKRI